MQHKRAFVPPATSQLLDRWVHLITKESIKHYYYLFLSSPLYLSIKPELENGEVNVSRKFIVCEKICVACVDIEAVSASVTS